MLGFFKTRFHQARPTPININPNEPFYYPFLVSVNKFGGSCNAIDGPHVVVCVPEKVKYLNVKVIDLNFVVNETIFIMNFVSVKVD